MPAVVRSRSTIELLKILSDGDWHNTSYLVLAAGKYIPPERASRRKINGHLPSVEQGRYAIIHHTLASLVGTGRMGKRPGDGHTSEWRLRDMEWADKMLRRFGEHPQPVVMTAVPAAPPLAQPGRATGNKRTRRRIDLRPAEYSALLGAKLAYENSKGSPIQWGTFLLLLLGFAIGGKLIEPVGRDNPNQYNGDGHMLECHFPYTCEEVECSHCEEDRRDST